MLRVLPRTKKTLNKWEWLFGSCRFPYLCYLLPPCASALVQPPLIFTFHNHLLYSVLPSYTYIPGFPCDSDSTESMCNAGELSSKPLSWEDPLEEGMATHSGILVLRSPIDRGARELQSMGSQTVRHD